ncbi:MAG: porin family protein [Endomicrobium sp.]|jgi:hypothetical protein|nr:porin family protein [Endomicrobium sp.]
MREAQKLGADDIVNIRIDETENSKTLDAYDAQTNILKNRQTIQKSYVYNATALAIKYKDAIAVSEAAEKSFKIKPANKSEKVYPDKINKESTLPKLYLSVKFAAGPAWPQTIYRDENDTEFAAGGDIDLTYYFNNYFGLGIGIGLLNVPYSYYEIDYWNNKISNNENRILVEPYVTTKFRIWNFYSYTALGFKTGFGIGLDFNNIIFDASFNYHSAQGNIDVSATTFLLSAGYKFRLK